MAQADPGRAPRPSSYFIKKQIITSNLFGVDIMEEATEIARLRLFLALVASAQTEDQLEPLPNIDFTSSQATRLSACLRVDAAKFDAGQTKTGGAQDRMTLQHGSDLGFHVESKTAPTREEKAAAFVAQQNAARFAAILEDKNKSIELYRKHAFPAVAQASAPAGSGGVPAADFADLMDQNERVLRLREHIELVRRESYAALTKCSSTSSTHSASSSSRQLGRQEKRRGQTGKTAAKIERHRSPACVPLGL